MTRVAKPDLLGKAAGREGGSVETDTVAAVIVGKDVGQRNQRGGMVGAALKITFTVQSPRIAGECT